MTKKSIDVQDEIEKIQAAKPVILKCSLKFAKDLRRQRAKLSDPRLLQFVNSLAIKPVGTLPDHIVLLCNAKGQTVKMINLTAKPKEQPVIIH